MIISRIAQSLVSRAAAGSIDDAGRAVLGALGVANGAGEPGPGGCNPFPAPGVLISIPILQRRAACSVPLPSLSPYSSRFLARSRLRMDGRGGISTAAWMDGMEMLSCRPPDLGMCAYALCVLVYCVRTAYSMRRTRTSVVDVVRHRRALIACVLLHDNSQRQPWRPSLGRRSGSKAGILSLHVGTPHGQRGQATEITKALGIKCLPNTHHVQQGGCTLPCRAGSRFLAASTECDSTTRRGWKGRGGLLGVAHRVCYACVPSNGLWILEWKSTTRPPGDGILRASSPSHIVVLPVPVVLFRPYLTGQAAGPAAKHNVMAPSHASGRQTWQLWRSFQVLCCRETRATRRWRRPLGLCRANASRVCSDMRPHPPPHTARVMQCLVWISPPCGVPARGTPACLGADAASKFWASYLPVTRWVTFAAVRTPENIADLERRKQGSRGGWDFGR